MEITSQPHRINLRFSDIGFLFWSRCTTTTLINLVLLLCVVPIASSQSLNENDAQNIYQTQTRIFSGFYSDLEASKLELDSLTSRNTSTWPDSLIKGNLKLKGIYYQRVFMLDSSQYFLEKVIEFEKDRLELSPFNLYNLAITLKKKREYKKALKILNEAQIIAKQTNNNRALSLVTDELSSVFSRLQNYQLALDYKLNAINLIENTQPIDSVSLVYANHNLADLYFKIGDYKKSEILFEESIVNFTKIGRTTTAYLAATNLSNTYVKLKQLDKADSLIKSAIAGLKQFNASNYISYAKETKAKILFEQQKLMESSVLYDSLVTQAYKTSNERLYNLLLNYFEVLNALKNQSKLTQAINQFVEFDQQAADYQFGIYDRSKLYKFLLDQISQSKNPKSFSYAKSKLFAIQDTLVNLTEFNLRKQIGSEFERKIIEKDKQLLEQRNKVLDQKLSKEQQLIWSITIIAGVLIICAILVIFYFRARSKAKAKQNHLLLLKEHSLTQKLKAEQELSAFKEDEIKEYKNRLISLAIDSQETKDKLRSYIAKNRPDDQVLMEISEQHNHQYWDLLIDKFKRYNFTFIKRLKELDPELSNRSINFCILVHLGIENRIIASALNISYETVITNKSRLKKKFKLDPKVDFTKYLEELT